jgi:hypothetical protein
MPSCARSRRAFTDTDDRHIHTVELDYLASGSLDDPTWAALIELNASYTYYPTYAQVLTDYNRPAAMPTFLVEANYEFEHNAADEGKPQILRGQAYWALLSGACGQLYGNRYTWPFISDWQNNLDTPGSLQMAYVKLLFESRPWYNLIPDQSHTVVTAGYGTFADIGALGDSDYLTAARAHRTVRWCSPTCRRSARSRSTCPRWAPAHTHPGTIPATARSRRSPARRSATAARATSRRRATTPTETATGCWCSRATSVPPDSDPPSVPNGRPRQCRIDPTHRLVDGVDGQRRRCRLSGVSRRHLGTNDRGRCRIPTPALSANTSYSYRVAAFDYAKQRIAAVATAGRDNAPPAPQFVQAGSATPQTPQSSVSATYADPQTAGNTNIVAIGWNDVTANIASVNDSRGNVLPSSHRDVSRQRHESGDLLRVEHRGRAGGRHIRSP